MIKVKSRAELFAVPKTSEPSKPSVSDVVNAALESLAKQAEATSNMIQAMAQSQQETGKRLADLAGERRQPIRLEADIVRDTETGKMKRVIITPIHK